MTIFPQRPSIQQLKERITADIDTRLPGALSRPAKSVISVLATVLAGAFHTLYGFADWLLQQLDPLTADESWLIWWGKILRLPRKTAIPASGYVVFSGAGEIASGALLRDQATGVEFRTLQAGQAGDSIEVESVLSGDLMPSGALQLVTPIAGIELEVASQSIISGAAEETLDAWALRLSEKLQDRKVIGDAEDYRQWALASHPDIVDAWVYPNTPAVGEITISVRVRGDDPFPPADVLAAAQQEVDKLRNAGATVYLKAPQRQLVRIRMAGISMLNREAVTTALQALIARKQSQSAEIYPEEIERVVSTIETAFTLLAPIQRIQLREDALFVLEAVEWVN